MRVVDPQEPGLGGPQVRRRGDGSHGPAPVLRHRGGRRATSIFLNPWGEDREPAAWPRLRGNRHGTDPFVKGLILAQNERWRRGLGMQVERAGSSDSVSGARVSKATVTNPMVGHSRGKLRVIPSDVPGGHPLETKALAPWDGLSWY